MKKLYLSIIMTLVFSAITSANTADSTKISGKPLFLIFGNFHQGITEAAHESNFDIKRAYLGYDFNLNNNFNAFIKIDIGSPDDNSQYSLIRRSAYFKNVGIGYTKDKLSLNFGIIDNQQHKVQEKFWGKRYIFKTFIDEYKFLSSADLGINASYRICKKISLEAGMMNGEYLSLQDGFGKYIYNIGININPVKQLSLKLYSSYTAKANDIFYGGFFIGYKAYDRLKIGLEYNLKYNMEESGTFILYGYSGYAAFDINKKLNAFARYDALNSNILNNMTTPWNLSNNGSAIIGGIEYKANENIRLSLNYQDWYPMAANMSNTAYIYFNLEFGIFESYKRI